MRGTWIRRLIPASVVGIVLALSYFAPAEGMFAPPVKDHDKANCGRNGYGYHGGKHNFTCPSPPTPGGVISSSPLPHAIVASPGAPQPAGGSAAINQPAAAPRPGSSNVVTHAAPVDVSGWRIFTEFLVRQLSSS